MSILLLQLFVASEERYGAQIIHDGVFFDTKKHL